MAQQRTTVIATITLAATLFACGSEEAPPAAAPKTAPEPAAEAAPPPDLDQGIVLALAQLKIEEGKPVPQPARLEERSDRRGGQALPERREHPTGDEDDLGAAVRHFPPF